MGYFANIKNAALSIFEGMSVTLSHFVRRPTTVQYPDRMPDGVSVTQLLPERYRGLLEVDMDICTACLACEQACPIECIKIVVEKDPLDAKRRYMSVFDIDMAKCMYCGLCSEPCPTLAIRHTREFQGAMVHLEGLIFRFVLPGEQIVPFKPRKGQETEVRDHGGFAQKARMYGYEKNFDVIEKMKEAGVTGLAGGRRKAGSTETKDQKLTRFSKELSTGEPDPQTELRTWKPGRPDVKPGAADAFAVKLEWKSVQGLLERTMAGTDCTACGYPTCKEYSEAIANGKEGDLSLCQPGGEETFQNVVLIVDMLQGKLPMAATANLAPPPAAGAEVGKLDLKKMAKPAAPSPDEKPAPVAAGDERTS
ncbi:MAG TPA: 4Fe-4S binding protein [Myxococcota bacterium]|jgi:formate hydrogenlyase subunit 6/NADH:ubiquinone oxidoreductase subunit I|nr:4Fe-4S binding protein [Myxococcota bacterium]